MLLVEDDELMVHLITQYLVGQGFEVVSAATGPDGLGLARSGDFDALLLDVELPGMSGVEVLRSLRREGSRVPVLIVSADDDKQHIATSLDEGADDYVPKPVDPAELPARIRAVLRRHRLAATGEASRIHRLHDLTFDEPRRSLTGPAGEVLLTATEASLLRELHAGAGGVVSADRLQDRIWGADVDPATNVLAVHISRLRTKLVQVGSSVTLKAVRNAGYQIVA